MQANSDPVRLLVVIDMQQDFIDGSLGSAEAVAIVPAVIEKIRSFDGPVITTRDTHGEDYLETHEGQWLPVVHCVHGTAGWQIHPAVAEALSARGGVLNLDKISFGAPELPAFIREHIPGADGPLDITVIGLCTDICVVSNALILRAGFPEADIHVDAACCAGVTPEKHAAALEVLRSNHIAVEP